ncbi:glycoside hydrolase superfamily [Kalaharituber pfeilii]|nr:glycoside hydrolase superfamily [Kalaharituber pfeilii]
MSPEPFNGLQAEDEYTLSEELGKEAARERLEAHWSTWFQERDVQELKAAGINALRIPIGYWAFENFSEGTPYVKGAEAYLDKAIGWARQCGMKVWVDLHGAPGSQNGFDNSGQSGIVDWQKGDNIQKTFEVLKVMARKYGSEEYADVVHAIELINEPISWGNNKFDVTYQFSVDAYWKVKELCTNKNLQIIMHDAFVALPAWVDLPGRTSDRNTDGSNLFGIDTHLYQVFVDEDKKLNQDQHAQKACGWGQMLGTSNKVMPTYVGEWTAATDICAYPDGHTEPGYTCNVDGCQCQGNTASNNWKEPMVRAVRKYMEAQLDAFEANTDGFFFWAWKAPGAWNFMDGVRQGWIPQPLTDRMFPNQCGFPSPTARRGKRNTMGAKAPF